jgi:peptide deformylase
MFQILQDGNKNLKKKAKRVDRIDDTLRNIAASMVETMLANNGLGISGNQVGVLKRIIVVTVNNEPKVMVNPEIVFQSDDIFKDNEGCLSFPNQFYDIPRSQKVTIKYRNLSGHPMLETHEGLTARCILHEIDHLDGIVFTEKINEDIK